MEKIEGETQSAPRSGRKPYRVLSLDGGGMRGTSTATYLAKICEASATKRGTGPLDLGAAFDLITGTSTGAIIACALAKGIPLNEVVKLYREHGPGIFSRRIPPGFLGVPVDIMRRPAALASGAEVLRTALERQLGAMTVGQVWTERGIALSVPAVEISQHRAWVFKTPHLPGSNHRDDKTSLVDDDRRQRQGELSYEPAAGSGWKRSDARDVTKWFEDERTNSEDPRQLRHTVRLIKKYAKSRDSWSSKILSGFGITKLVAEEYRRQSDRHDMALYDT